MFVRLTVATLALLGSIAFANAALAQADNLCKPGDVLDAGRQVCYNPSAAYRPNFPEQKPFLGSIFGGSSTDKPAAAANAGGTPAAAPSSSSSDSGFFGWLSDQARFCRYGDRQVGSGDTAYCITRAGKTYPAGK